MAATARRAPDALPEPELIVRAQEGDTEAREVLARRYRLPAYRLAMQLLGRREDAKDVAQDAMMRFFSSLDRFEAERPVLPWLFRIVHNRVRDLERRRRRRRVESLDRAMETGGREPAAVAPDPELEARRRQLQRHIWQALSTLSSAQREILVLREYQDLSYAEIAAVLGIPKGTVMSRLHAARCSLRERLQRFARQQDSVPQRRARRVR